MKKTLLVFIAGILVSSCSIMSSNYISSTDVQLQSIPVNLVAVYYNKEDVPFKYKEIGRIYLKNINYWADRDPAGQIKKIKNQAAVYGAEGVIIVRETRKESSFYGSGGGIGGSAGDVFQYSGIAIIRK
jgi:hypothetical protein